MTDSVHPTKRPAATKPATKPAAKQVAPKLRPNRGLAQFNETNRRVIARFDNELRYINRKYQHLSNEEFEKLVDNRWPTAKPELLIYRDKSDFDLLRYLQENDHRLQYLYNSKLVE